MNKLEIKLFGEVRVVNSAGETVEFTTKKAVALLLLLANPVGRAMPRERLAGLLWSRNSEEQARTNLRQNLSRLRKALGPDANHIITSGHEIVLDHECAATDVSLFESLANGNDPSAWAEAASYLSGELAAGLQLNEPDFDDWLAGERRRTSEQAIKLLSKLLRHFEANEDFDNAADISVRLLSYDPLNEAVHHSFMKAAAALGRYEAALQQFKLCRDILHKELGIEPTTDIQNLRDEILRFRASSRHAPMAPAVETSGIVETLGKVSVEKNKSVPNLPPQLQGLDISAPKRPSIVILPFNNLTGDDSQDHLGDGIRIDIQAALVKITGIFLIAAGSANAMRGKDCQTAGRALGVSYVLQGSIRRAKEKLRVSAELIAVESGEAIWTEVYDRKFDDGFSVQDEIIGEIIKALDIKLLRGENAAVWHKTLTEVDALECFYKGVNEFFKLQQPSMLRARRLFEAVDRMQPDVSIGATWVALCHWFDAFKGWGDRDQSIENAEIWSSKAVAMKDPDGQAHMVLSHVHLMKGRFDDALIVGREAVQLRPNCTNANGFFANVLHYCGHQSDAIEHIVWAIRYSPVYPPFFADVLSLALLFSDMNSAAAQVAEESLRLNPSGLTSKLVMSIALFRDDNSDAARLLVDKILSEHPGFSVGAFAALQPYQNPSDCDAFSQSLLSLGLPA